jgi:hypothetical protein
MLVRSLALSLSPRPLPLPSRLSPASTPFINESIKSVSTPFVNQSNLGPLHSSIKQSNQPINRSTTGQGGGVAAGEAEGCGRQGHGYQEDTSACANSCANACAYVCASACVRECGHHYRAPVHVHCVCVPPVMVRCVCVPPACVCISVCVCYVCVCVCLCVNDQLEDARRHRATSTGSRDRLVFSQHPQRDIDITLVDRLDFSTHDVARNIDAEIVRPHSSLSQCPV